MITNASAHRVVTTRRGESLPLSRIWVVGTRPYPKACVAMTLDKAEAFDECDKLNDEAGSENFRVYGALIHIEEENA